jgi:hypothetical protein
MAPSKTAETPSQEAGHAAAKRKKTPAKPQANAKAQKRSPTQVARNLMQDIVDLEEVPNTSDEDEPTERKHGSKQINKLIDTAAVDGDGNGSNSEEENDDDDQDLEGFVVQDGHSEDESEENVSIADAFRTEQASTGKKYVDTIREQAELLIKKREQERKRQQEYRDRQRAKKAGDVTNADDWVADQSKRNNKEEYVKIPGTNKTLSPVKVANAAVSGSWLDNIVASDKIATAPKSGKSLAEITSELGDSARWSMDYELGEYRHKVICCMCIDSSGLRNIAAKVFKMPDQYAKTPQLAGKIMVACGKKTMGDKTGCALWMSEIAAIKSVNDKMTVATALRAAAKCIKNAQPSEAEMKHASINEVKSATTTLFAIAARLDPAGAYNGPK